MTMLRHRRWNFDIDQYIGPAIPGPPWQHLPYTISRFLGYRREKPAATGNLMPTFWALIGVFSAIIVLEAVVTRVPSFESHGAPIIVGSFGAAAVLEFYAIESPLAQPRNVVVGQLISVVTGVCTAKLFLLSERFDDIRWIAGALACACATALMALTKTVHPPAGATALLAVVDKQMLDLGWLLVPLVLLSCALMLAVALVLNNIERQFPAYWWTPEDQQHRGSVLVRRASSVAVVAPTAAQSNSNSNSNSSLANGSGDTTDDAEAGGVPGASAAKVKAVAYLQVDEVVIKRGQVIVPEGMFITQEEELLLESMCYRL